MEAVREIFPPANLIIVFAIEEKWHELVSQSQDWN
jgi:hypothetical protein